jgi:glutathione S-transferase
MKLYSNPASPFARKCRIIVRELGLANVVEEVNVDTRALPPDFRSINPLGKIPALMLKDGSAIFDSPVICEYLNDIGGGKFFPGRSLLRENSGHWKALTLQALGDGICDAAVARVYETRRPAEQQSQAVLDKHLAAIETGLSVLENAKFSAQITIGEITIGCAIGYLDFRMPELSWRDSRPKLRDWYEKFAQYPSMKDTWPVALA